MDSEGPLINISVSKSRDSGHHKAASQLPDRSRVIIGSREEPHANRQRGNFSRPASKFPRAVNQRYGGESHQASRVIQERPEATADFASANYLPRINRHEGGTHYPSHGVTFSGSVSVLGKDRRAAEIGQVPNGVAVQEQYRRSADPAVIQPLAESASGLPKKSRAKSKLSIPTTSDDVSKNWQAIKTVVGKSSTPRVARWVRHSKVGPPISAPVPENNSGDRKNGEELQLADKDTFVKTRSFAGLTKKVAMDCEFVGVGPGAVENMLARVSVVNQFGHCIYDTFVKPTELVKDYRTHVSGVRPQNLKKGEDFKVVQAKVAEILKNRILVGHAIRNDLEVLLLSHPKNDIRDTSRYRPFRILMKGGTPSLKRLTAKVLGVAVQTGEHDSIQDAQAAMRLYTMHKREWESGLSFKGKKARLQKKIGENSSSRE